MTEETGVAPETEATEEAVVTEEIQEKQEEPETPETEEQQGEESEESKPKSRHQRRKEQMERLHHEADEWKAKFDASQAKLKRLEEVAQGAAAPQESDYGSFEEYQAALSAHHAMQMMDKRQKDEAEHEAQAYQREMQRVEQAQQQEMAQEWAAQVDDARTRYADYDSVAFRAPISQEVAKIVASMDSGADVAYHLGLNPVEAQQISSMSPVNAAIALGRLEARLSGPKPRTTTQAPDPVTPVRAKATPAVNPEKMSMAEYKAARAAGKI